MSNNNPFMNAPAPSRTPSNAMASDFSVDLTDVKVDDYTIPDGNYRVRCEDIQQQVSKGGNPMFVWDFAIVGGQYDGKIMKVFTAITPAAMWKVAETVIALGVGQTGEVVKFKRTDVVGKECGAAIEATEYDGKTRSQIARVMSLAELAESSK